jgi:hypothetical protein
MTTDTVMTAEETESERWSRAKRAVDLCAEALGITTEQCERLLRDWFSFLDYVDYMYRQYEFDRSTEASAVALDDSDMELPLG